MKNTIKIDKDLQKVLLIGANGFLGTNLLSSYNSNQNLSNDYQFIAADIQNSNITNEFPFYHIDITNPKDITKKIITISPNLIILTAAMIDVDKCEQNKRLATKINFQGTKNIIKVCKKIDCKLLFMSTDFVFDGYKENGNYSEDDKPNPLNHYGKTKFQAEKAIINSEIEYLICRTAVLYGWDPNKLNFITWILNNLEKKKILSIVKNQVNSPTFVVNLSQIIIKLIEKGARGIFHTAGDCSLSRFEMALKCAEIFNYNQNLISPIEELNQTAIRPKNVGFDIDKLKNLIGRELKIFNFEDGLNYMKNHRV